MTRAEIFFNYFVLFKIYSTSIYAARNITFIYCLNSSLAYFWKNLFKNNHFIAFNYTLKRIH